MMPSVHSIPPAHPENEHASSATPRKEQGAQLLPVDMHNTQAPDIDGISGLVAQGPASPKEASFISTGLVKLFKGNAAGEWDDCATGLLHLRSLTLMEEQLRIEIRAEADETVLLLDQEQDVQFQQGSSRFRRCFCRLCPGVDQCSNRDGLCIEFRKCSRLSALLVPEN